MKQYIVDAFTDQVFTGNPAAVCIMQEWPSDERMQDIAIENNLSDTAFAVRQGDRYELRWFTPGGEIALCGHATLASAFVILNLLEKGKDQVIFDTKSGPLPVRKIGELYEMDFPAYHLEPVPVTQAMADAVSALPKEAYLGRDLLLVFEEEETIRSMQPDLEKVRQLDGLLLQVTARGSDADCVSRTFAPKVSVPEDPVCGSGHCHIIPYWAKVLGKDDITAYQASRRGGTLYCRQEGDRVKMSGKAVLFSIADLFVDQRETGRIS